MLVHNAADEEERPSTPKAQENMQEQNTGFNTTAASLELVIEKAPVPTEKPQSDELRISFDSIALELCARRVAAESGDVRKSLEACRLAAQAAVQQVRVQELCLNVCAGNVHAHSKKLIAWQLLKVLILTLYGVQFKEAAAAQGGNNQTANTCAVKIGHVSKTLALLFAPKNLKKLQELPLHQVHLRIIKISIEYIYILLMEA
jgi:hypothetical protein